MGQYFMIANLDRKEYVSSHKIGDGLKLLEQANSEGGVMNALHLLLACGNGKGGGDLYSMTEKHEVDMGPDRPPLVVQDGWGDPVGRWAFDRIVVIGDYAEREDHELAWSDKANAGLYAEITGRKRVHKTEPERVFDPETASYLGVNWHWVECDFGWKDITDEVIPMVEAATEGWRSEYSTYPDMS